MATTLPLRHLSDISLAWGDCID